MKCLHYSFLRWFYRSVLPIGPAHTIPPNRSSQKIGGELASLSYKHRAPLLLYLEAFAKKTSKNGANPENGNYRYLAASKGIWFIFLLDSEPAI